MREIRLTKNKVALVDDIDFEGLNQFKWQAALAHDAAAIRLFGEFAHTNFQHQKEKPSCL